MSKVYAILGKSYVAIPSRSPFSCDGCAGNSSCDGCAGINGLLCTTLPDCFDGKTIFVAATPEQVANAAA